MLSVGKNQHRWKMWVTSSEICRLLDEGAETLKWAWAIDKQDSKSYPQNTGNAIYQLKEQIQDFLSPKKQPIVRKRSKLIIPPPAPKCFAELVEDRSIMFVYEDQNSDTYAHALQRAGRGDRSAFRKILRAIEHVFVIDRVGLEAAPVPKVQFLHRRLLEIAKLAGLNELTDEGFLEFLDDICPCEKGHGSDAIRKLRKRLARP